MKKTFLLLALILINSSLLNGALFELWNKTYVLKDKAFEIGSDIQVDGLKGDIYITGLGCDVRGANAPGTVAVRKINADGEEVWVQTCDIGISSIDASNTLTVDKDGNVYVAGFKNTDGKGKRIWVRKYNQSGVILWDKTFAKDSSYESSAADIVVDCSGNVFVAGYENVDEKRKTLWAAKLDPSGLVLWQKKDSDIVTGTNEEVQGICSDKNGDLYITGSETGDDQLNNLLLRKYDTDGKVIFDKHYAQEKNRNSSGNKIAVDSKGNIYLVGLESFFYQGKNIFLNKYDNNGNEIWIKTFENRDYNYYSAGNIIVDKNDSVYISASGGGVKGALSSSWISRLDPDGHEIWKLDYSGTSYGVNLSVDGRFVYVLGLDTKEGLNSGIWVKKYQQASPTGTSAFSELLKRIDTLLNERMEQEQNRHLLVEAETIALADPDNTINLKIFIKGLKNRLDVDMPLSMQAGVKEKSNLSAEELRKYRLKAILLNDSRDQWVISSFDRRKADNRDNVFQYYSNEYIGPMAAPGRSLLDRFIINSEKVENRDCYCMRYAGKDAEYIEEWLDKVTLEDVKYTVSRIINGESQSIIYSDFRKEGAISMPYRWDVVNSPKNMSYVKYTSVVKKITMNPEMYDDVFDADKIKVEDDPKSIELLKKIFGMPAGGK